MDEGYLDDLRAFGINANQWTTAEQGEGSWRKTAEKGAGHFMEKLAAAEKSTPGLRYADVCMTVTERTQEEIAKR